MRRVWMTSIGGEWDQEPKLWSFNRLSFREDAGKVKGAKLNTDAGGLPGWTFIRMRAPRRIVEPDWSSG